MQKFLSLLMAAMLCLCALLPAMAEEAPAPAPQLPITVEAYQKAYEALIADIAPGSTVTWRTVPMEEGECYMGMIDNAFVGVMMLHDNGQVTELAVLMQAGMTQDVLMTFLSLAGYAGATLLRSETVTSTQACDAFLAELIGAFQIMTEGGQPPAICGLPAAISITPQQDGSCQYYFILKLTPAE